MKTKFFTIVPTITFIFIIISGCVSPRIPFVKTEIISDITDSSCKAEANLIDLGSYKIAEEYGWCWGNNENPVISANNYHLNNGRIDKLGVFSNTIHSLEAEKKYYIRPYIKSGGEIVFGEQRSFTTLPAPIAPTVTTDTITEMMGNYVSITGNITNLGNTNIIQYGHCWSITENPTINNAKTELGASSSTNEFTSKLTGLASNTVYYVRAYAKNIVGISYGEQKKFKTKPTCTDIEGNNYIIVTIGTQTWMAENLKATKYNDGTPIPNVEANEVWKNLTTPAYCWYENDEAKYKDKYGALYNWYAVASTNTKNICPAGWHVPSDDEWTIMENYLADNGYNFDGTTGGNRSKIAKSLASKSDWKKNNSNGTVGNTDYPSYRNKSGFMGLPAGYRMAYDTFIGFGTMAFWWSNLPYDVNSSICHYLMYTKTNVVRMNYFKENGNSVRCIKD